MAPYLRRTWNPRGQTPVLKQRTRHHLKVSIIAALVVSPQGRRVRWCFRLHVQKSIVASSVQAFLRQLGRWVRGPVIVVWDRLKAHRAVSVQQFLARHRRFRIEWLPPYAPELNPAESIWGYWKHHELPNFCPRDFAQLGQQACRALRRMRRRPPLIRSFWRRAGLSL